MPLQWQTDSLPRTTREALGISLDRGSYETVSFLLIRPFLREEDMKAHVPQTLRCQTCCSQRMLSLVYLLGGEGGTWPFRLHESGLTGTSVRLHETGLTGDQRPSAREGAHRDQRRLHESGLPGPAVQVAHAPLPGGKMLSTSAFSLAKDAFFASPQSCQTKTCLYFYLDSECFTL